MLQTHWREKREEEPIFFSIHSINCLIAFEMAPPQVQSPVQWGPELTWPAAQFLPKALWAQEQSHVTPNPASRRGRSRTQIHVCFVSGCGPPATPARAPARGTAVLGENWEQGAPGRAWGGQSSGTTLHQHAPEPARHPPTRPPRRRLMESQPPRHPLGTGLVLVTVLWEGLAVAQG